MNVFLILKRISSNNENLINQKTVTNSLSLFSIWFASLLNTQNYDLKTTTLIEEIDRPCPRWLYLESSSNCYSRYATTCRTLLKTFKFKTHTKHKHFLSHFPLCYCSILPCRKNLKSTWDEILNWWTMFANLFLIHPNSFCHWSILPFD